MNGPRIGELFAGYGGLGLGVQAVLGGEVAWFSEFDPAPSKILAHHWPDIPNVGDITLIDWSTVPPVDILTGGFPCQDVSLAGARAGFTETSRSGLWSEFARAIAALKPRMVLIENVRGLLSAEAVGSMEHDPWSVGDGSTRSVINALGAVLGDLANLGYDADWCGIRAADAGAPHGRFRVFIVAYRTGERRGEGWTESARGEQRNPSGDRSATAADTDDPRRGEQRRAKPVRPELPAPQHLGDFAGHTQGDDLGDGFLGTERAREQGCPTGDADRSSSTLEWGDYAPAIARWEAVTRPAPAPSNRDGKNGSHRLSARFVEWMMGLPEGHVTNIGLTRNQQLKALGNGVVPQQAELALRVLLRRLEAAA